jgi:hypothetical protein
MPAGDFTTAKMVGNAKTAFISQTSGTSTQMPNLFPTTPPKKK